MHKKLIERRSHCSNNKMVIFLIKYYLFGGLGNVPKLLCLLLSAEPQICLLILISQIYFLGNI